MFWIKTFLFGPNDIQGTTNIKLLAYVNFMSPFLLLKNEIEINKMNLVFCSPLKIIRKK